MYILSWSSPRPLLTLNHMSNNIASLFTSKAGLWTIVASIAGILTWAAPLIPQPWGGLATAILAVIAYYKIGGAVTAGRVAGARGI